MNLPQIIQQLIMLGALLFQSSVFLPLVSTTPPPEDTLASIGPNRPLSVAPCNKTLNPGDKIQTAIDAVRDKTTAYVLCLNPGFYIGGQNGDTTFEPNHDFGDRVVGPDAGGDWWNQNDDGPYYGTIVIKNRHNFTLRGLIQDDQRATILGLPNDILYPPETAAPKDQYPNDKALLLKIVNGDNITIENLTIDGFYYPDFPDRQKRSAVLNRLVWLQHTTNSHIIGNIIEHAGSECVRLKADSTDNELAYNTIASCGYYQFKVQPIARLRKNGEGIYVGTDPYQINANQINKSRYFGLDQTKQVDGTKNNLIHHNDIFPGSQQNLTPVPQNELLPDVKPTDGYGNECIDIKEDLDDIGRMVKLSGVAVPQLINNVVRDNLCQGQFDEDSGAGICGNVANEQGVTDWGTRRYKGKQQAVQFSRVPSTADNLPQCQADANNYADTTDPGIRGGCAGAICTR